MMISQEKNQPFVPKYLSAYWKTICTHHSTHKNKLKIKSNFTHHQPTKTTLYQPAKPKTQPRHKNHHQQYTWGPASKIIFQKPHAVHMDIYSSKGMSSTREEKAGPPSRNRESESNLRDRFGGVGESEHNRVSSLSPLSPNSTRERERAACFIARPASSYALQRSCKRAPPPKRTTLELRSRVASFCESLAVFAL